MSDSKYEESRSVFENNRLHVHQPEFSGPDIKEAFGGNDTEDTGPVNPRKLEEDVVHALKTIYDPEIPVNIYELGLIYGVKVTDDGNVNIKMTLTAPACPVAGTLVQEAADKAGEVPGVRRSHVELVWDPPWTKDRMTEEALLELGLL